MLATLEHGKGRRSTELAGGRLTTLENAEAEGRLLTTAVTAGRGVTLLVVLQQVKLRSLLSRVLKTAAADLGI